jgi:hypothetical protein
VFPSWVGAGEAAGESRVLDMSGAVNGGTYGCRYLVEGIDVVALTYLS